MGWGVGESGCIKRVESKLEGCLPGNKRFKGHTKSSEFFSMTHKTYDNHT